MDEITKQIIIEKIILQIKDYKVHADELLNLINLHFKEENDRFKLISISIIERYYVGLISIQTLLETYKFYTPMKFGYANILRTMLNDFITIEYLYFKKSESETVFIDALKQINHISAKEVNQYVETQKIDKTKFRNWISKLFPENFNETEDGNNHFIKSSNISPWNMAEYLKNSKYPYGFEAYPIYSHYSKIAHFSNMSTIVRNEGNNAEITNMLYSMYFVIQGHDRCLEIIDFFPKQGAKIIKKRSYILNLIKSE